MGHKIIDFHNHAFPEKIERKAVNHLEKHYSIDIPSAGSIHALLASAESAGVNYLVLHASATHKNQVISANDWIASLAKSNENLIGFGTVHPGYEDCLGELERIKELGLKGLKLHPDFQGFNVDDPSMYYIYEAIEPGFPILIHVGDENLDFSSPRRLSRVLELFPHLTIIGAHLGGYARWDEARQYLVGKKLYLDTSSSLWRIDPKEATELIKDHGVDRIVFGSDYPVVPHGEELDRFLALFLTEDEREKILWENGARILKL